jgi:hypothetical protein
MNNIKCNLEIEGTVVIENYNEDKKNFEMAKMLLGAGLDKYQSYVSAGGQLAFGEFIDLDCNKNDTLLQSITKEPYEKYICDMIIGLTSSVAFTSSS